jgi:hypothetical protein
MRYNVKAQCVDESGEMGGEEACVHFEYERAVAPPFPRVLSGESEGDGTRPFPENAGCKVFQAVSKSVATTATANVTAAVHPTTTRMTD